jgi:hypothetical protein
VGFETLRVRRQGRNDTVGHRLILHYGFPVSKTSWKMLFQTILLFMGLADPTLRGHRARGTRHEGIATLPRLLVRESLSTMSVPARQSAWKHLLPQFLQASVSAAGLPSTASFRTQSQQGREENAPATTSNGWSGAVVSAAKALAVRRFDRVAGGAPVHMEDFAQVFGQCPNDKYKPSELQGPG